MPSFDYIVCNPDGSSESGVIEAPDRGKAVIRLQGQGKTVIKVESVSATGAVLSADVSNLFSRVGLSDLMDFTSETDTLLQAGMPLERTLRVQAELCTHPKFKVILSDIVESVNQGKSFSEALEEHDDVFDDYYVSMVRGGEASGTLGVILGRLAEYMQKKQKLRGTIIGAMIYPSILLFVSLIAVVTMMTWVIPKFKRLFESENELPVVTRLVLGMSNFFISYWWLIILGLVLIAVIYKIVSRTEKGRLFIGRKILALPVAGELVRQAETTKFCRMMSTLLEGQVPILQSISIAITSAGNEPMARLLKHLYREVQAGRPVGRALSGSRAFPEMAARMISMGEESGELAMMMGKIADRFEDKVEKSTSMLISMLEPAIIVILGTFIGFIVVGIMMAIMSASQAV